MAERNDVFTKLLLVLVLVLLFTHFAVDKPEENLANGISSFVVASKMDKRYYPRRNSCSSRRYIPTCSTPPSTKTLLGIRLIKLSLGAGYFILLANDINLNPGPVTNVNSGPQATNLRNLNTFNLPTKGLRFGQWNVNYLTKSKLEEIKLHVLSPEGQRKLDILVLTETFFSNKTSDELYNIHGFDILRKDRKNGSGGGIAIYVNSELNITRRTDLEEADLEVLWLQVSPFKSKRSLLMAGIYRSPNKKVEYDRKLSENIERAYMLNMETILTGDFNLDYLKKDTFNRHRLVKELKDSKFIQKVSSITRPASKSCLDHIWSTKPERIVNIVCPDICISDHLPVLAVRLFKHCPRDNRKKHKYITYRNLKHLDHVKFIKTLEETP